MSGYVLRPMRDDERAFVAKSWVESFSSSAMAKLISHAGSVPSGERWSPSSEYWSTWNRVVDALIDRSHVVVAENEVGLVAGFLAWERTDRLVVHYLYVRLSERGRGVAKHLLAELPAHAEVVYTHRSRAVSRVPDGWLYSLSPLLGVLHGGRLEAA